LNAVLARTHAALVVGAWLADTKLAAGVIRSIGPCVADDRVARDRVWVRDVGGISGVGSRLHFSLIAGVIVRSIGLSVVDDRIARVRI
jgi:hypothetical protein